MSGHSKWSTIKRKKGAADAKRGKLFTKLVKEITIAAREGLPDPEHNPRLRLAVQNAKGVSMPKDNIERAIKKASGADGIDYIETTYEAYGPNGVGIFMECTTDNLNRTVQNIRSYFTKCGGSLGTNGSLEFIFSRKGVFILVVPDTLDADTFTLELIDAGAEEVEIEDGYSTVLCALEDFGKVQKALELLGLEVENAELRRIPNTFVKLDNDALPKVLKLIDMIEDDDDIQKVYHNLELSDEQLDLY